ncbi:MAG: long-chain fatty acid--CoA ligase [Hyphomicrobiales bacterium]|nr:long-chain fatty acid--CoA ligase [Hyphomicrobiales bacterium]MCP5075359.1 long-chain fatty acid--CoA ligase [Paracoccaceae bacterium]
MKSASTSLLGHRLLSRIVCSDPHKSKGSLIGGLERWLIKHFITRSLLDRFGGRLRLTVCGGAPLSAELARALRSIGLPLVEGYGLAEAAGPVTGDSLIECEPGTVGRPLPGIEVRIANTDEILIRSASVMSGYWKRSEETAKAVDQDGWLHTSDIGELRNGRLIIHGRMQDLIILSTGEKFAPSDIESQITTDLLFEQALVIGDRRPIVVALVVLDRKHWQIFAQENGLETGDPNDSRGKMALLEHIGHLCRTFPDYAQVRRLQASFDPWTAEIGLLSVTQKVKRDVVSARFADQIEDLFLGHH